MRKTPKERSLQNSINSLKGWSKAVDRPERTRAAREAQLLRYLDLVDPDNQMSERDKLKAAQNLKTVFYKELAQKRWQKARREAGA